MTNDFVTDGELPAHLHAVSERWEELGRTKRHQEGAESIQGVLDGRSMERLFAAAKGAKSSSHRVMWLHRAADTLARAVDATGASACQKGCDSCCHIPVLISKSEADYLAKASKRRLASHPSGAIRLDEQLAKSMKDRETSQEIESSWSHHVGTPCPFLVNSACSVWASRPMACRYHFTLDRDNLLCRLLVNGQTVEVPRLNTVANTAISLIIQGLNQDAADIRDWFPAPRFID